MGGVEHTPWPVMRRLIDYFQSYFRATWSLGYVLSVLGLAGALVYANFFWRWPAGWLLPRAFLLFALPYGSAVGL